MYSYTPIYTHTPLFIGEFIHLPQCDPTSGRWHLPILDRNAWLCASLLQGEYVQKKIRRLPQLSIPVQGEVVSEIESEIESEVESEEISSYSPPTTATVYTSDSGDISNILHSTDRWYED